jgi:hypothetical protein
MSSFPVIVDGSTVSWGRMGRIGAAAVVEVVGGGGSVPTVLVGGLVEVGGAVCDVQAMATTEIARPTAAERCRIGGLSLAASSVATPQPTRSAPG